MTETSAQTLDAEMTTIAQAIDDAVATVDQGYSVDLAALGKRVDGLCIGLLTLPATDAHRIGARLPAITEVLDRIAQILLDRRASAVSVPSDSPVSHGKAARAYGTSMMRARR
jgi:hypothetical protein